MPTSAELRGIMPVVPTCFNEEGQLDLDSQTNLIRYYLRCGVQGLQLFGNAIVTREPLVRKGQATLPRLEFRGEFLHAWVNDERVRSNQPVTLKRGSDTFTADSMDYDNLDQILNLRGRVHGTLQPAARR